MVAILVKSVVIGAMFPRLRHLHYQETQRYSYYENKSVFPESATVGVSQVHPSPWCLYLSNYDQVVTDIYVCECVSVFESKFFSTWSEWVAMPLFRWQWLIF